MAIDQDCRWRFIEDLDRNLLKGGVVLSEWCSFIVREADIAFVYGANLSAILTAMAAVETHLRHLSGSSRYKRLVDLIDRAALSAEVKSDLHMLRKYRNKWVHVEDPENDSELATNADIVQLELEEMAQVAIRNLRVVIYSEQSV